MVVFFVLVILILILLLVGIERQALLVADDDNVVHKARVSQLVRRMVLAIEQAVIELLEQCDAFVADDVLNLFVFLPLAVPVCTVAVAVWRGQWR